MTAALDTVRQLVSGRPEAAAALLGTCRVHAYGVEAFGGAMACALFARQPAPLSREPHVLATARNLAIFDVDAEGHDQAIFADLYDGHIGRLWRLGPGRLDQDAEPGLAVAADVMLSQLRSGVALSMSDHPDAAPGAEAALRDAAIRVAQRDEDGEETIADGRAMVVRAFTQDDRGVALLALDQPAVAPGEGRRRRLAAVAFRFTPAGSTHQVVVVDDVPTPPRPLTFWTGAPDAALGTD